MNDRARRNVKTESLSLRLDPKTKFMLEFVARVKGQSITMVVERAIGELAELAKIGTTYDQYQNEVGGKIWKDFWDPSEGVRCLRLISNKNYPTTFDEDELYEFTRSHWEFFFADNNATEPHRVFVNILWPSIDRYLKEWAEKKATAYWAAGEMMKRDIQAAGLRPPDWPRRPTSKSVDLPKPQIKASELDDEIPF